MIEYFKKLTEEEVFKFERFIYSPYFNSHKILIKLFDYLKFKFPNISEADLSKENLSLVVYGEEELNDVKMRKLFSDFALIMERFLTQLEVEANERSNKILLLGSLRRRGFTKRFEMNYRELARNGKRCFSKDDKYYLFRFQLENEYYYYNFSNIRSEFAECIQDKSDNLDYYFMFSKLHTFHEMIHSEGRKNKNKFYKKKYFNEIISFIEKNKKDISENHPNLYIIYNVILMFDSLDDTYLKEILKYLKTHEKKFRKENLSYYFHYITQYYINKVNLGQIAYRQSAFDIFKIMREKKLFLIDNIITDLEFNNVSNMALALGEYEWIDEFIEEYKNYLDPEFSRDAYNLAKAKLLFHKKDYENIFRYLNEIEFKDPNYYINSKFLLGRVYYDIKNIEAIKYIVNNLRQYARVKKKLTIEQTEAIKTFNKYINELIKIYESNKSERKFLLVILQKELDNEKRFVPAKNWMYEKVKEL